MYLYVVSVYVGARLLRVGLNVAPANWNQMLTYVRIHTTVARMHILLLIA